MGKRYFDLLPALFLLLILVMSSCCKHKETELVGVMEAGCVETGYTGDTLCIDCGKIIAEGEVVEAKGHKLYDSINVIEPSCTKEGYSGDIYCSVCGELVKKGEPTDKTEHIPGDLVEAREPTCTEEGYTGYIKCVNCGEVLEEGVAIAMLPHTPGNKEHIKDPTCQEEGNTGDIYCTVCGYKLESGKTIPKLAHVFEAVGNGIEATCVREGYSGDRQCKVCGYYESGVNTAFAEHTYKDLVCTECGWRAPGFYKDNKRVKNWDELENESYISVDSKGNLISLTGNYQGGVLVLGDDVTSIEGFYGNETISELWLPRSIKSFSRSSIDNCPILNKLVIFSQVTEIPYGFCSGDDTAIETIVLPEGLETVKEWAFNDNEKLTTVEWPSTLKIIESGAFARTGLVNLDLPDSIQELGRYCFGETNLVNVVLPSSIAYLDRAFNDCNNLKSVDLSNCINLKEFAGFESCHTLSSVNFPPNLQKLGYSAFRYCYNLKEIILPDSLNYVDDLAFDNSSIETIVWPVSILEMGDPYYFANLKEIRYCGSKDKWEMCLGAVQYPNVIMRYNWNDAQSALYTDKLIVGTIIGNEYGWNQNYDAGAKAAFDRDRSTFFDPLGVGDGYCGIKTDVPYILERVEVYSRSTNLERLDGAVIQGSNDGVFWKTLFTFRGKGTNEEPTVAETFENNNGFTYFRYYNEKNHGDVADIMFFGTISPKGMNDLSTSELITGTIIGNDYGWDGTSGTGAQAAFDGNVNTFFDPLGVGDGYCGIKAAKQYILTKVEVVSRSGWTSRLDGAEIQGSNDGLHWVSLCSFRGSGSNPKPVSVENFENNYGYSMFRYYNTVNHGDVAEVSFYGHTE